MKILYVYEKMPGIYQKYLSNLLSSIKSVADVKTLSYLKSEEADFNVKTYGFRDNCQRLLYKLGLSKFKCLDLKTMATFEIIHLQHSYLHSKLIPLLGANKKNKIVITLRGADTYIKPWVDQRWNFFYKNYGNKVDAFITMSHHQKEYLTRWGVSPERIHVIPISFGLHSNTLPKYPNEDKLKLVSAFRMTWEKNIEGTIQFAKILKEKNIPFQYDIYGDGNDLGQLYYLIDRYNLHDQIIVKGKIENDELKIKLRDYDFFVQLSLSEALPTSVLEAQSIGLPCIVSDSNGLPEAVLANKTAIVNKYSNITELVDGTISLWKDKELYFQYSAAAITFVNENFTIEREIERLNELYKKL